MTEPNDRPRPRNITNQNGFVPVEDLKKYGKRTGKFFGNVNPNDRTNGMARWSDYLTDSDESDSYIPLEPVQNTTAFSLIPNEPISDSLGTSSELPSSQPEIIYIKSIKEENNELGSKSTSQSKVPKDPIRVSVVQKQIENKKQEGNKVEEKKMSITNRKSKKYTEREERLPFSSDISSIKKRAPSVRPSQKYLLDLLSSKNKVDEKQQVQYEKQEKQKQRTKQETMKRQRQEQQLKQRLDRERQEQQRREVIMQANRRKQQQKRAEQQRNKEKKEQQNRNRKRVTINDRGKVKLPTDSISLEYDPVLPPSLRKDSDSSSKKRPRPQSSQEDTVIDQKPEFEPMDIIPYVPEVQTQTNPPKEFSGPEKGDEEQEEEEEKDPSPPKVVIQKPKKGRAARVTDPVPKKENEEKKRGHTKKQSKKQTKKERTSKNKTSKNTRKAKTQIDSNGLQNKRKKLRKLQQSDGENPIVTQQVEILQESDPIVKRSARVRIPPRQYWNCQNPIYQNKKMVFTTTISPQEFLDIIGFDRPERIKASIIDYSGICLEYKIEIKPKQFLYSTGINYQKLQMKAVDSHEFNRLEIVCLDNKPDLTIIVDEFRQLKLNNHMDRVVVKKGETIQIKNDTISKTFTLQIKLTKSTQWKK